MFKQLYVVRRTFKTEGEVYLQGEILEDISTLKLAKIKLNEGKIVPLPQDEQELEKYADYFQAKIGVDLKAKLQERASKGSKKPEPVAPKNIPPTPGTKVQPQVVKPVVKPLSGKN